MKKLDWETLSSEYLLQDRWIKVRADTCRTPEGKIITPYYVLEYDDWANAVALTEDRQVILLRIYRQGIGKTILEIPGGNIDKTDGSPEATIRRELLEETGYIFDIVEQVAIVSPNPANHSNQVHCFLATGGKKIAEPQLELGESIEVVLVTLKELENLLIENKIHQAMHVSTIFYALQRLNRQ